MNYKKTVRTYLVIIFLMIIVLFLSFVNFDIISKAFYPELVTFDVSMDSASVDSVPEVIAESEVEPAGTGVTPLRKPLLSLGKMEKGEIMEISAYNLVKSQCDNSPLIGAFGDNLMELMDQGIQVCASNVFPENTKLYIQSFGKCVVKDRMNSRYKNHVDICMGMDVEQALSFGRRDLRVSIIN